ncbi:1-acyl-sn-glycerol-3-phosphate acyltransferase [Sphingomonas oleivorans]|uniref:1-acyl-sn-glycerol-3-phosphate acyltransferase n=1 Tax=Sphingomonas oleivorans TaxID=1735121 RepID=A0A2T5G2F8_9SPHN|nr:lysophospholipid acyltransferase family protein [Sphingomonas oleivorans]PTQ13335.1 1-acyl-sn-glycerol-3-phosphate acyltransferase [Sphingomonas oleivorans]
MALLRSLAFAFVFYGGTILTVLVAFPVALAGPAMLRRYVLCWARFHRWCAATLLGIRTRLEGTVPTGPTLVAAKHQSMYETLELVVLLGDPAIVLKRELADIPLWGKVARMHGVIPVDRAGSAPALRRMLGAARDAVAGGRTILIFPEGTRVLPGETPPLRPGFAGLYRQLALPVVPVALDSGRLWPRGLVKQAGTVTIRFGEPIPPGLPRKAAEARVHAAINALEPALHAEG